MTEPFCTNLKPLLNLSGHICTRWMAPTVDLDRSKHTLQWGPFTLELKPNSTLPPPRSYPTGSCLASPPAILALCTGASSPCWGIGTSWELFFQATARFLPSGASRVFSDVTFWRGPPCSAPGVPQSGPQPRLLPAATIPLPSVRGFLPSGCSLPTRSGTCHLRCPWFPPAGEQAP